MLTDDPDNSRETDEAARSRPRVEVTRSGGETTLQLSGLWTTRTVQMVDKTMRDLEKVGDGTSVFIDLSAIAGLDTSGAWLVQRLAHALGERGATVTLKGEADAWEGLFEAVGEAVTHTAQPPAAQSEWFVVRVLESLGRAVYGFGRDFLMWMHVLGSAVRGAQMKLGRGAGVSPAAVVKQIDRMGIGAVPVIILMSTIIGAIIAQQGAFQLRYFGAEIFVVDLVGILVLREIGVLLTAIMIAGRSGSAITAEIGSMKMREETDALTVIGLNPVGVLVFPRLVALVIGLPLLTVIADASSLVGAGLVAWSYSGIPPHAFLTRLRDAIDMSTYLAGIIKAPFMALIIGIIASVEGMKVGGSAESLGLRVTSSVVKSIFVVIVVDGLFAMFYAAINF